MIYEDVLGIIVSYCDVDTIHKISNINDTFNNIINKPYIQKIVKKYTLLENKLKTIDIDFGYIVMQTCYTDRITTGPYKTNFFNMINKINKINNDFGEKINFELLFICDEELYEYGTDKEETKWLYDTLKKLQLSYGVICIRCNDLYLFSIIEQWLHGPETFCNIFCASSEKYIITNKYRDNIKFIEYDSESG